MTLDKYIKILEEIRKKEGGDLEVGRVVRFEQIQPRPRVHNFNYFSPAKEEKVQKMLLI